MSNKPLKISEEAAVQMPMKTGASLIVIVALGTMGYFQIIKPAYPRNEYLNDGTILVVLDLLMSPWNKEIPTIITGTTAILMITTIIVMIAA